MSDVKLGQLIEGEAERDCVHVALAPVVAAHALAPGSHVGFLDGGKVGMSQKPIGIVDPFLKTQVMAGEKFWLVLYQNTVTGMRHQWAHPSFKDAEPASGVDASKFWLQGFAGKWNMDFKEMIDAALNPDGHRYLLAREIDLHGAGDLDPGEHDLFWHHLGIMTGRSFPESHREKAIWTCTC